MLFLFETHASPAIVCELIVLFTSSPNIYISFFGRSMLSLLVWRWLIMKKLKTFFAALYDERMLNANAQIHHMFQAYYPEIFTMLFNLPFLLLQSLVSIALLKRHVETIPLFGGLVLPTEYIIRAADHHIFCTIYHNVLQYHRMITHFYNNASILYLEPNYISAYYRGGATMLDSEMYLSVIILFLFIAFADREMSHLGNPLNCLYA